MATDDTAPGTAAPRKASDAGASGPTNAEPGSLDVVVDDPTPAGGVDQAIVARFEAELAAARRLSDEHWDRYLRAEAELDNLRKRTERMRQEAVAHQRRELLGRFLEVVDNLERALGHADADPAALKAGIESTYRAIRQMLEREGVAPIEAMGRPFDPHLHEALGVVEMPDVDAEQVVAVEQSGYTLDGQLLRAARVVLGLPAREEGAPD